MKVLLAILLIAATPALALAQSTAPAKPAAKSPAKKPVPKKSRKLAPAAQKAVEEVTPIEDDPSIVLSEADLEVARKVHVGDIPCELGATVKVMPMKREGMFSVMTGGHRFRMHPVESRTGAIRLEDPQRGAMWLQLGNKSMLMSQKLGQRLADECQSPAQVTYADMLKKNPLPSILEPLPGPQSTSPKAGPN
jgi:Ni/Co efflux regulator RcnB